MPLVRPFVATVFLIQAGCQPSAPPEDVATPNDARGARAVQATGHVDQQFGSSKRSAAGEERSMADFVDSMEALVARATENRSQLTVRERALVDAYILDFETVVSGLDNFFRSSAVATETADGLRLLGAPESAKVIDRACALFPGGEPPEDPMELGLRLGDIADELEALDWEFSEASENEDLRGLTERVWLAGEPPE